MTHPRDLAAQCFLPYFFIVGPVVALTALFYGLGGENPLGQVIWILTESWNELSPLMLFVSALWGLHLVSYLLVGSFARDVWIATKAVQRLAVSIWRRFVEVWTEPSFLVDLKSSLSPGRLFRRSLPLWLATVWRAGDSVQLE